jgi:hypothetical protein
MAAAANRVDHAIRLNRQTRRAGKVERVFCRRWIEMPDLLKLRPIRRLAFVCIDSNLFRHALEERLKRPKIAKAEEPRYPATVVELVDGSAERLSA